MCAKFGCVGKKYEKCKYCTKVWRVVNLMQDNQKLLKNKRFEKEKASVCECRKIVQNVGVSVTNGTD